jgi:mono/diheme cytochrome c family protein
MKNKWLLIITVFVTAWTLLAMTFKESLQQEPWVVPDKYEKMKNPFLGADDTENVGRLLFAQHCKSCHGSKGKGDGKKAASLDTPIGDFTLPSFKKQSDGALYYKTYQGRDDMPSFEKKITEEEDKWLVINYIKSL